MSYKQRRKILVVDDEPEIRRLLTAMLTEKGYRVWSAENGEKAIRLFKENPTIDLLLADVITPGMSGPMIAEQVTALNPAIQVLFMTGYGGTRLVDQYVAGRGYALLMKPFTTEELEWKIRSILGEVSAGSGTGA